MEYVGIVALGSLVGSTLKSGIVLPSAFAHPPVFVLGMFSVLCAATAWLLAATLLGLPVSTTHTIVAGIFAFGLLQEGPSAVNTGSVVAILISWIASPLAGCAVAFAVFFVLHRLVVVRNLARDDAGGVRRWADRLFPVMAGITAAFMALLVLVSVWKSAPSAVPVWVLPVVPIVVGVAAWAVVFFVLLPQWYLRQDSCGPRAARILNWGDVDRADDPSSGGAPPAGGDTAKTDTEDERQQYSPAADNVLIVASSPAQLDAAVHDANRLFVSLMALTAALVAFAHSANDIANSVAPFMVCYEWVATQKLDESFRGPTWIYLVAGLFLVLGLVCLGYIVMRTIGEKVTRLRPMAGFSAQLAASIVVVTATLIGLPISTTHVIVGAVTGVGLVTDPRQVQWRSLGKVSVPPTTGCVLVTPPSDCAGLAVHHLHRGRPDAGRFRAPAVGRRIRRAPQRDQRHGLNEERASRGPLRPAAAAPGRRPAAQTRWAPTPPAQWVQRPPDAAT